ncbi:MAG: hypothetical protein K8L97_18005 [Anaerolineae bacterium]|nr:hypothetical protein [Anaerolineae bacterium]
MTLNWRLFIPILMLILAALACDDPVAEAIKVDRVEVDANVPGRAYARVLGLFQAAIYQTDDYGATWQPSEHVFAESPVRQYSLFMSSETLKLNDQAIWSFPRYMFRFFFYEDDPGVQPRFALPYGDLSNAAQGDTLYVAMGTEGVLIGRIAPGNTLVDWRLSANGIDVLNPLPLTITHIGSILGIIALALLVPPVVLLHSWMLYCVWIYFLPRPFARRRALQLSLGLSAAAAVACYIWLTDIRTDFFPVVGVVTLIVVLAGLTATYLMTEGQLLSAKTRRWLLIMTLLVSLLVPAGVVGVFTSWWAVFIIVFGFGAYRWAYFRHLGREIKPDAEGREHRWHIDRLALETMTIAIVFGVVIFWVMTFGMNSVVRVTYGFRDMAMLGIFLVGLAVAWWVTRFYVMGRASTFIAVRRGDAERLLRQKPLLRDVRIATVIGVVLAGVFSWAVFVGQFAAYGWFTTLLRP